MQRGEGLPLLNISLVCHLSKINSKPDYVRLMQLNKRVFHSWWVTMEGRVVILKVA